MSKRDIQSERDRFELLFLRSKLAIIAGSKPWRLGYRLWQAAQTLTALRREPPVPAAPPGCFQAGSACSFDHDALRPPVEHLQIPLPTSLSRPVTVIIPVYNSADKFQALLDSLLPSHGSLDRLRFHIIDDCSTEPAIQTLLRDHDFCRQESVRVKQHGKNLRASAF